MLQTEVSELFTIPLSRIFLNKETLFEPEFHLSHPCSLFPLTNAINSHLKFKVSLPTLLFVISLLEPVFTDDDEVNARTNTTSPSRPSRTQPRPSSGQRFHFDRFSLSSRWKIKKTQYKNYNRINNNPLHPPNDLIKANVKNRNGLRSAGGLSLIFPPFSRNLPGKL